MSVTQAAKELSRRGHGISSMRDLFFHRGHQVAIISSGNTLVDGKVASKNEMIRMALDLGYLDHLSR